jgi:hypothetical protein
METSARVLGSEHPNTLTSVNNLAFESRTAEGGGRAGRASDGDVFEGAWFGAGRWASTSLFNIIA